MNHNGNESPSRLFRSRKNRKNSYPGRLKDPCTSWKCRVLVKRRMITKFRHDRSKPITRRSQPVRIRAKSLALTPSVMCISGKKTMDT